jgi:TetR/AcrR family transcriptional regulator
MNSSAKTRSRSSLGTRNQPEASRDAILQAAASEFAAEGRAGARMDAIARSARVNKALLYYYFRDKDALYRATLDQFFGPLFQRLTGVLDGAAPAGERILGYVRAHFDTISEAPHYARLFQGEMMSDGRGISPHVSRVVNEYMGPLAQRLQAALSEGIERGEFRRLDVFQFIPSMVATIVFYFVTAPVLRRLRGFDPFSVEAIQARRAAVLDQIAGSLFADRAAGLRLAEQIAANGAAVDAALLPAPKPRHHVAARKRKLKRRQ